MSKELLTLRGMCVIRKELGCGHVMALSLVAAMRRLVQ